MGVKIVLRGYDAYERDSKTGAWRWRLHDFVKPEDYEDARGDVGQRGKLVPRYTRTGGKR